MLKFNSVLEARAKLISGRLISGEVTFIASSVDKNTRTFRVEISVDNEDRTIRDGVSAEILYQRKRRGLAHKISPAILSLNDQGKLGLEQLLLITELNLKKLTYWKIQTQACGYLVSERKLE